MEDEALVSSPLFGVRATCAIPSLARLMSEVTASERSDILSKDSKESALESGDPDLFFPSQNPLKSSMLVEVLRLESYG